MRIEWLLLRYHAPNVLSNFIMRGHVVGGLSCRQCVCNSCGKQFVTEYGFKRRTYCSKECLRRAQRRARGGGSHRARAKKYGVEYQYINPVKVFRRDNWTCQLCGKATPEKLRSTLDDRALELDHIQPISKGGPHTYANVQCTCRACNAAKGDKPMGQLKLFAA